MTKFNKEKWAEEKTELERELIQAKSIVQRYEGTLKPFRDVTDTDYREAKAKVWQIASELSEGNYQANKPHNPLDDMSKEQLQTEYDKLKAELMDGDPTQGRLGQVLDRDKMVQFNAMGNRLNELKQEQESQGNEE